MIHLTFPDNSVREFPAGVTGREIAEGISKSLAKKAVAMALDGKLADLSDPIDTRRAGSRSSPATIRARSSSSATTPRTSWPRRCRSSIPARRSPSAR